ncbi:SPFH domain-containing protein [Amycolatopsis cynarae]|uniref:SPFH domain-containing protein n=1 Tax=Amycolatopsis cynarae TaxID=2995223 RepID=A0ABY7B8P1_9PSEU|nr:SPFH domain-containing protein [Amycolatopsis sp. HUAS 11-8]WAL67103.1 SPFH domain-containing protein [Amycolatopsis sp. HUAS 11-8]
MTSLIFITILVVLAVVAFVAAARHLKLNDPGRHTDDIPRGAFLTAGGAFLAGALLWLFLATFTTVSANAVGIVTAFGKPVGTVSSGAHFLAPWDSVEEFTTRIQVTQRLYDQNKGDQPGQDCVEVNLAGGAKACADMTIRYVINANDAVDLWKRYGSFDSVRDSFLRSATDNAAKIVYGQYQPQEAISGDALPAITQKMTAELTKQLSSSGLTLVAVAPGQLHLDPGVQNRLNGILDAQTQTTIAQQNLAKNQAQAAANQALTNSLSEPILVQECLDAAKEIKPTYFNCFPGGSSGTPLINIGK